MTPEALARIHAAAFTTPRPWSAGEFAALLAMPGVWFDGDAAGFVLGRAAGGEAELLTLAVHPDHRRAGRGRALLAAFETVARVRGAGEAFLEVAETNAAARALYAGAGYGEAGRRPGYFTTPGGAWVDALVLRKPL